MTLGISGFTNVTMDNITGIANVTEPAAFYVNVNADIYGGWLIFFFMLGLMFMLFQVSQRIRDQPIPNLMYSALFVSIVGFAGRAVFVIVLGVQKPLITDVQLWIFPIITAILAGITWMIKKQ